MKDIVITRQDMIDAVLTEPLARGSWYADTTHKDYITQGEGCTVCAVGGILRMKGLGRVDIIDICDGVAYNAAGCGGVPWLVQLSDYFETDDWRVPSDLVIWIKKNIPENYKGVINGYSTLIESCD